MKTFVAIFLALAVFEAATGMTQEYQDKFKAAVKKCAKEFNIEESVVKEFVKEHKLPETDNGKCMLACTMEELKGLVDGKIDVAVVKENNKQKWEDPAIVTKANEIADKCNGEVSSEGKNKCEYAVQFASCMLKNGKEMNIPAPQLLPNPARR